MTISMDRFTFVDPPEPRYLVVLALGRCAWCNAEIRDDQEDVRVGEDGYLYCDVKCVGYSFSDSYDPTYGGISQ